MYKTLKISFLKKYFTIFFLIFALYNSVKAQTTQVYFGQNRVQYHDFDWQYYNTENFTVYFYLGGQELGKDVWQNAEIELTKLQKRLDYTINTKLDILVYNDITDFAQTNIGLENQTFNSGGTARIHDSKLFLYFDGNHQHLIRDLKKGIAEQYIRAMMMGSTFGQKIQNAIFLQLPNWYKEGLINYIAESWNTDLDNELKQYFLNNKVKDFKQFALQNPVLAGHSFWQMINEKFGDDYLQNILYLTRVNHNINSGMLYATNSSLDQLTTEWKSYYQNRYEDDIMNRDSLVGLETIKIKKRNHASIGNFAVSTDGKYIVYAAFDGGFYKIFLKNTATNKIKKIAKGGFKSDNYPFDKSYPIMAFSKYENKLAFIQEKKDIIKATVYDLKTNKKTTKPLNKLQKVYDVAFGNSSAQLILAAQNKGQTDIYTYNFLSMSSQQITNDLHDDLSPNFVNFADGKQGIIFSSNRENTNLNFDLNFYDVTTNTISKITNTDFANEKNAKQIDENTFSFWSDENGIGNQYIGNLQSFYVGNDTQKIDNEKGEIIDSIIPINKVKAVYQPFTNLSNQIINLDIANNATYFLFAPNKKQFIYKKQNNINTETKKFGLKPTQYRSQFDNKNESIIVFPDKNTKNNITNLELDSLLNITTKYTFESAFNTTLKNSKHIDTIAALKDTTQTTNEDEEIPEYISNIITQQNNQNEVLAKKESNDIRAYRAKFTSDYVVTQLDNSVMTNYYQSFNTNLGNFSYPDFNALISFGITDLMEDHKLVGGFTMPLDFSFSKTNFFVKYMNTKKRIDKTITFFRTSTKNPLNVLDGNGNIRSQTTGKNKSHFIEFGFSYPFDVTNSFRWAVNYRNDRLDIGYADSITFLLGNGERENWISGKAEFVHDNTKEIQTNITNGLKYKFYTEFFWNANQKKTNVFVVGFDIRHYQKIHKNIIWANRFTGASSFGSQKILYYLGGTDSWLNAKYDNTVPIPNNIDFAFQTTATNLRGLPRNIRNGNNFLLWNSELRIPLFSYLAKKQLKQEFLRDFQIVTFFDAGLAYTNKNPFNASNAIREEIVNPNDQSVIVTVNYYRNPFVAGYGIGLRTSLLGYFVKVDAGFGYDGLQFSKKPMWNISLIKDF